MPVLPLARRRYVGAGVGDEAVAIGHADFGQGVSVDHRGLGDDAIQEQDVGCHGVHLVVSQHAGIVEWHRPVHIVPDGGGVGPVTAHGPQGLGTLKGALATRQWYAVAAFAFGSMTLGASIGVSLLTRRGGAAALRQTSSIGTNGDVPVVDLFRRRSVAEAVLWGLREEGGGEEEHHARTARPEGRARTRASVPLWTQDERATHWSHSRPPSPDRKSVV